MTTPNDGLDGMEFTTVGPDDFDKELNIPGDTLTDDTLQAHEDTQAEDAIEEPEEGSEEGQEADKDDAEPDINKETAERVAKLARDNREMKRRLRQQELDLQAAKGERQETIDEQTERLIEQRATQRAAEKITNDKVGAIVKDGHKAFGEAKFNEATNGLFEDLGPVAFNMMRDALMEIPDVAPKLLMHLSENPDIADDIASMTPARMGVALAKEAAKLAPKGKSMTKTPAPVKPISVNRGATVTKDPSRMSMEEFVAYSDAMDARTRGRRV